MKAWHVVNKETGKVPEDFHHEADAKAWIADRVKLAGHDPEMYEVKES